MVNKMAEVIGISGSPRAGGNTDILLNQFLKGITKAGLKTEKIFLRDYSIQPCTGCEQCRKSKRCCRFQDGMQLLYPKIEESKGIIIGSPAYNYNVTPWIKIFIDRLYQYYDYTDDRPRKFSSRLAAQGRKGIVYAVCEQMEISYMGCTLEAMRRPLEDIGYKITCEFPAIGFFERGAILKDDKLLQLALQKGLELGMELKM
jgi:multimeric flavodoxin WrbA